jgi:GTP-binding protein Era
LQGIIVGQEGRALKKLGSASRRAIEEFLERPVYLELGVKAVGDWRTKKDSLKEFGYYDPLLI